MFDMENVLAGRIFDKTDWTLPDVAEQQMNVHEKMDELCDILEQEIIQSDTDNVKKQEMLKKLRKFSNTKTNIMVVGATGCGKSSTINALFSCGHENVEIAKVGTNTDPETKDIEKYTIGNLTLWDTPGLGDGTVIDEHHIEVIRNLLREKDDDNNALIDLVLVILDGSSRDLGTSYRIINDVIIPELGDEKDRILVALNQADIAMKTGRHWNYENNEPDEVLLKFLEEKTESIRARIEGDSHIKVNPVYYCAGYTEENGDIVRPYNLSKLLYYIMSAIPMNKRVAVAEGMNVDSENFVYNDNTIDYEEKMQDMFGDDDWDDYIDEYVDKGMEFGKHILGVPGAVIGALFGGLIGCARDVINDL